MGSVSSELLEEIVNLVHQAGELSLQWFRNKEMRVSYKPDGTPVTDADRAVEEFLRDYLEQHHPDDSIVGEEYEEKKGQSLRRWIVDPIDGTKAFTRGVPLYTNLLALEDGGEIVLGVINIPALKETVYAGKGLGCYCNGQRVRVSEHPKLIGSYLTTSSYDNWPEPMLINLRRSGMHMRTWGDGYGYALVATGRVEAMVDTEASVWDLAPMPVIIGEAGGKFTDLAGEERIDGSSGVATNGMIHTKLLKILKGE